MYQLETENKTGSLFSSLPGHYLYSDLSEPCVLSSNQEILTTDGERGDGVTENAVPFTPLPAETL